MPLDAAKPLTEIGSYDLVAMIAEGGMGTVYKGRRQSDGQIVAIKIIPPAAARNPILLQRFKREFIAASALDHENIVKALEFCEAPPNPYLVMEFVDGESVGQRIERLGKIPEAEAIRLLVQVCKGLYQAHKQNMIHRDVKPDNIMITWDGKAKLTDLGLVKDIEGEMNLTRTGRGLGTPHFMAPEQFRNAKNADVRCDVYSLGATLYMMVTGKMPFDGCGPLDAWMKKSNSEFPAPRELEPSLSERVDWAIRRAMSADPEKRPASCREFVEDLTGQSTKPSQSQTNAAGDLWYMVYRDDDGGVHTVKGTTDNIRRAYRDRLLGDAGNIRACRTKQGPFQPLNTFPEFRDLVIDPEAQLLRETPPPTPSSGIRRKTPANADVATQEMASQSSDPGIIHTPSRFSPGASSHFPPALGSRGSRLGVANSNSANSRSAGGASSIYLWIALVVLALGLGIVSILLLSR